jgi:adenosylmethionine---8-amino-7-oxononanoate aminotransferase
MDIEFDHKHIWHPYTSLPPASPVYPVVAANKCILELQDGTNLIDGMSSWWSAIHGYNHPRLNAAITQQIDKMAHVMFGGLTHAPAIELAELLIKITPDTLDKIFFADSGSISVEVAMKIAIQFFLATGDKAKHKFLTIRNGYHGDTFASMSVSDPENGMHHLFADNVTKHYFAPPPTNDFYNYYLQDIAELEKTLKENVNHIAGIILEPIVQNAGGMRFYSPEYLRQVRKLCSHYNVLLILDEIATGFGRTGKLFACEHAGISPDIMCIGKALTGGYMTLAATLTTKKITDTIAQSDVPYLMHGPTFMANPLACSVALASTKLLLSSSWQTKITEIEKQLTKQLEQCRNLKPVKDVRVLGAIGVIEMHQKINLATIQEKIVKRGVWIRPFSNLLYIMPPFIITSEELKQLTDVMHYVIKNHF